MGTRTESFCNAKSSTAELATKARGSSQGALCACTRIKDGSPLKRPVKKGSPRLEFSVGMCKEVPFHHGIFFNHDFVGEYTVCPLKKVLVHRGEHTPPTPLDPSSAPA